MKQLLVWYGVMLPLLGGVAGRSSAKAPEFQGKPLADWIKSLEDPDPIKRVEGVAVLAKLGPAAKAALPALTALVKDEQPTIRFQAAVAVWKIDRQTKVVLPLMIEALKERDRPTRQRAAQILKEMGTDAKDAAPVLGDLLLERSEEGLDLFIHHDAADVLLSIGVPAMPALLKALHSKNAITRWRIVKGLAEMGPTAKEAVQPLTLALKDDDVGVRVYAAIGLWKIDGQTQNVIPILIDTIKDESAAGHRTPAVVALGEIGPRAQAAVPVLLKARTDGPVYLRKPAETALKKIDPDAAAKAGIR